MDLRIKKKIGIGKFFIKALFCNTLKEIKN